jgi:hypothetical protein
MPDPDWALHGIVLGVLAAIGAVITLIAFFAPSRGGIISLGPLVAFFLWIGLGLYGIASTLTFGLFGHSWGAFNSYLAALPLAAVPVLIKVGRDKISWNRRYAKQVAELVSRFELLSWSHEKPEGGRVRLRAEIRALRDLDISLDGIGWDASGIVTRGPEKPEAFRVTAGGTTRLSVDLEFPPDRPPVRYTLDFATSIEGQPSGQTWYSDEHDRDTDIGDWHVSRPLPPPSPSGGP